MKTTKSYSVDQLYNEANSRVPLRTPRQSVLVGTGSPSRQGGDAPAVSTRTTEVVNLFGNVTKELAVYGAFWDSSVGVEPWLLSHMGSGKYLKVPMQLNSVGGYEVDAMGPMHVMLPYQSAGPNTGDITITQTGASWGSTPNTTAYDGAIKFNANASTYYEWTSPANTTMVGQRGLHQSDGGLCLVEINGDTTLATSLPTAQDLVDNGTIASLGTLNATDRILDCHETTDYLYEGMSGGTDTVVVFANDLTPGTYTVRVTNTGVKATASSSTRLNYSGVIYRTESTRINSDNVFGMGSNPFTSTTDQHGGGLYFLESISPEIASVNEFVMETIPSGAATEAQIGNGHGNEDQTSITYYVGGVEETISGLTCHRGGTVRVVRLSQFFHPEVNSGNTPIANCRVTYELHTYGVKVTTQINWLLDGSGEGGWMHMFALNNSFNLANTVLPYGDPETTADKNLDADDNQRWLDAESDLIYAWQETGSYAAALYIPDVAGSNNNYQYVVPGQALFQIQDRDLGSMNKIYFPRGANSEPILAGDTWIATAQYLVGLFESPTANDLFAAS